MHTRPAAVLGFALLLFVSPSTTVAAQTPKSLYDRLGGYNAISAVVDQFADRLFADPKIARFFVGMSTDSRMGFKQKNKNLVCAVTGGPCQVISRPAKTAHAGLGITGADFEVVVNHLVAVLDGFKVPAAEEEGVARHHRWTARRHRGEMSRPRAILAPARHRDAPSL